MSITVYSTPTCSQCAATYRKLDQLGVDYAVVDVTADREARDMILSLGYRSVPVVFAGDQHWSGYRPDRLTRLAALVAA